MSESSSRDQDPELQAFLDRFRLASPTRIHDLAGRSAASIGEPRTRAAAKGGIEALVAWNHFPISITFDPTGRCNVVCEMCDFHRVRSEKGWPQLVEAARGQTREIAVITNGTAISEKVREQIVDLQLEVIRVSLHGATAATAMDIMRGSQFEAVKRNLSELVRLRDERGLRFPRLQISFVGMKKNIDEFPDFVELAADLGADSVTLSSLMERPAEGMEHTQGQSLVHDPERLRENWQAASRRAKKCGISLLVNEPYRNLLERAVGRAVAVEEAVDEAVAGVAIDGAEPHSPVSPGENLPGFCAQCPRAPNVEPKTMEMHAALLHARSTGRITGIAIALWSAAHYGRYLRELARLHIEPIRLRSIVKSVVLSVVRRMLGLEV